MNKIALIMAAGEGTRMMSRTPKMLSEVCGVPMVEHVLRAVDSVCGEKVLILSQANRERMAETLSGYTDIVVQGTEGWGTGYAVKCAADRLSGKRGAVLITAGDMPLVLPESFARLYAEVEAGNHAAILTEIVDNPVGYGRVVREGGRVARIVEQKDLTGNEHSIREMNSSVYCFDIDALLWALPRLDNKNNANEYYLTDVIGILYGGGYSITTVPTLEKGECMGINNRIQLADVEREMRRRINARHMNAGVSMVDPDSTYIQPDVMIGRDTVIHPGCEIGRGSRIGENCVLYSSTSIVSSEVGDDVKMGNTVLRRSSVGNGCRLEFSHIIGSTLGAGVVAEFARLERAEVPDGEQIPPFTSIKSDK